MINEICIEAESNPFNILVPVKPLNITVILFIETDGMPVDLDENQNIVQNVKTR